jgi:ATP-binding cassette subfamily B protein
MLKIAKRNLQWWAVVLAVLFMVGQVICDLTIPTLTSEIINRGVVKQDLSFITHEGWIMMGVALIGLLMAIGNIYFAATQAMKVGKNLRAQIYQRVFRFSEREMSELGTSSLITRSTNDVVQIQNVIVQMLRMMIQSPIMLVAACFLAYRSEPRLTKIFLISLPILAVVIIIIMSMATPLFKSIRKRPTASI